jgi:CheY-like chemotaxis protein
VETPRVLIIEDDRDIRDAMEDLLKMEGFTPTVAMHGRQALELLETIEAPCLILLDLVLPQMDGREFLERIKSHPIWSKIPVLLLTANTRHPDDALLGVEIVRKPFNSMHLLDKIRGVMGQAALRKNSP